MASSGELIVGICYLVISVFFFILNGLLFATLFWKKDLNTITYRIIKSLTISCMMQLFAQAVGGIMTIAQTTFDYYIDRVLGVAVQSGWTLYVSLTLTLGVDRVLIFICPISTAYMVSTTLLLSLSWLLWLVSVVVRSLPGFGTTYGRDNIYYIWTYCKGEGAKVLLQIEPYFIMSIFAAVLLLYVFLVYRIVKMKMSSTTSQSASFRREVKILLAAVISFVYEVFSVVWGYWILPNEHEQNRVTMSVVLNFTWIVECGMFVTMTLIISNSLRKKLIRLVLPKYSTVNVSRVQNLWDFRETVGDDRVQAVEDNDKRNRRGATDETHTIASADLCLPLFNRRSCEGTILTVTGLL
uniref:G_PROTEIN_RECEP_F1_2 domain-containing protein n=1 Tax=Steinernema glaseri TaxID=37863 RepID=A0A1I7Y2X9_9BILA